MNEIFVSVGYIWQYVKTKWEKCAIKYFVFSIRNQAMECINSDNSNVDHTVGDSEDKFYNANVSQYRPTES